MRIFFLCRTGHHTSIIAAGLYLGLLEGKNDINTFISRVREYGNFRYNQIGTPCFIGKVNNEEVYTIGGANEDTLMERAVNELLNVIGADAKQKKVINVCTAVSQYTKGGILLSRFHLRTPAGWFFRLGARNEVDKVEKLLQQYGLVKKKRD